MVEIHNKKVSVYVYLSEKGGKIVLTEKGINVTIW
jgi:hypothetical protein